MSKRTHRPPPPRRNDDEREVQLVYGIHPVEELVASRGHEVERLFMAQDGGRGLGGLLRAARAAGIPVTQLPRTLLAKKLGAQAVHQGVAAQVAAVAYAETDQICRDAARRRGMLVLLDRVVDPANLGSILRTSRAAGVAGLVLASESTVGLTPVVAKVSAGAVEHLPVARERRLAGRIEALGEAGFSTVLLDPREGTDWDRIDLRGPLALVAGGEERGVRPAVAQACSARVAIPLKQGAESLNVAIAVGVLLFEAVRQRRVLDPGLETSRTRC